MARVRHDRSRWEDLFVIFFFVPVTAIGTGLLTLVLVYWMAGPPGR